MAADVASKCFLPLQFDSSGWSIGAMIDRELTLELVRQEGDKREAALCGGAEMVEWDLIVWRGIVC